MEVLELVITGDDVHKMLDGQKNVAYLEYSDYYISRLCERDDDGEPVEFKHYDTVHFRGGVAPDARDVTYRIKNMEVVDWLGSDGEVLQTEFAIYLGERVEG